jgi:class 3 adenylate cyclase
MTKAKSFDQPDEVLEAPGVRSEIVHLGPLAIGREVHDVGWRWSTHIKPVVGTELCRVRHVGFVAAGRFAIELPDGSTTEIGPGSVYDVPPGHDGWTIGSEPVVLLEWTGAHEWLLPAQGERILASLLLTDIVGSTQHLERLGDRGWRALIQAHDDAIRCVLAATRGREVNTTGDGFVALFDGPARAIQAAALIRERVRALELELRQGVHVGEVEMQGKDIRGLAVHEAARIMAVAGKGEILASSIARTLASGAGFNFVSRGLHQLKGIAGEHELFAVQPT